MPADIDKLSRQISALQARKNRAVAQRTTLRRRRDAHCKILLGGALLALLEADDRDGEDRRAARHFRSVYERVLEHARARGEADAEEIDAWLRDREEIREEHARKRARGSKSAPAASGGAGAPAAPGAQSAPGESAPAAPAAAPARVRPRCGGTG